MLSRYILPSVLIVGFLSLVGWDSWGIMFSPKPVTVIPVIWSVGEVQREGTPLCKAAGWIEPRPTPVRVAALALGDLTQLIAVDYYLGYA